MEANTLKRGTGRCVEKSSSGYVCARWEVVVMILSESIREGMRTKA
jgi:hypothetical protein